ncbi:hypothetical protein KI387_026411, partial [Taxus chinensis]
MKGRGSQARSIMLRTRISAVMLSMAAVMSSIYVAGRLWQDAENRIYLSKELDRRTGQGQPAISVDDTLKILGCREQKKRLAELEMELAAAKQQGFVPKHSMAENETMAGKRLMAVIGIVTEFGHKSHRDSIRKSWMPTGPALRKLEEDKGIIIRFVIGRSANRGDSSDKAIDDENRETKDFLILENHVESSEESSLKSKLYFASAADTWDADFYAKVNDNVYVNIDKLGAMLATHWDKPRAYIGCMKSGEVFANPNHKWYEPESWKFGDGKSYFRHASGEMYVISRAVAQFISINNAILHVYAHEDTSVGSWMLGISVKHIDESQLCCSSSAQ